MKNGNEKQTASEYFDEAEAARRISEEHGIPISRITLFRQRKKGAGIVPYYRIGGRIYYDRDCIAQYLQNSKRVA